MENKERLTLVWTNRDENWNERRNEILLHEFVHELLENNGIRPNDWRWNEGLVTYITKKEINELDKVKKENSNWRYSEFWNIYVEYTRKWVDILDVIANSKERKKIILDKIDSLNY